MNAVHLRRMDPTRNMSRFYRLDIQPDLFGRVLLKQNALPSPASCKPISPRPRAAMRSPARSLESFRTPLINGHEP